MHSLLSRLCAAHSSDEFEISSKYNASAAMDSGAEQILDQAARPAPKMDRQF